VDVIGHVILKISLSAAIRDLSWRSGSFSNIVWGIKGVMGKLMEIVFKLNKDLSLLKIIILMKLLWNVSILVLTVLRLLA
jgi:hypothetical protein